VVLQHWRPLSGGKDDGEDDDSDNNEDEEDKNFQEFERVSPFAKPVQRRRKNVWILENGKISVRMVVLPWRRNQRRGCQVFAKLQEKEA